MKTNNKNCFLTFPACFSIAIIFSNLNYNCSNLLDMRNLQEQVKKAFCYQKLFWPFTVWINCSSDLKKFANSWPSASNFKCFSRSLEQVFLTVGQNNFGNKIPRYLTVTILAGTKSWGHGPPRFLTDQLTLSQQEYLLFSCSWGVLFFMSLKDRIKKNQFIHYL